MSSQEQIHITGFSRLILSETMGNLRGVEYSGIWISKCKNWLIAPTSGRGGYRLLAITQDGGIRMMHEFNVTDLIGSLEYIIKNLSKIGMYITDNITS